jgi:hypothetical protein
MTNTKDPRPLEQASMVLRELEGVLKLACRVSPKSPMINLIRLYHQQLQEHFNNAEKIYTASIYECDVNNKPSIRNR